MMLNVGILYFEQGESQGMVEQKVGERDGGSDRRRRRKGRKQTRLR